MQQITISRRVLLIVLLLFFIVSAKAYCLTIADSGLAKAVIVIDKHADAPEQHAANELAAFLEQVTGAQFTIANDTAPAASNILVGPAAAKLAQPDFSTEGLGVDGVVIRTVGDDLILAGGKTRGTLYAVYTFLEDYVGCRWWTAAASTIPTKSTLTVGQLDVTYVPVFEYRDVYSMDSIDPDWSVRNKRTGLAPGARFRDAAPLRGGCINWWPTSHSFFIVLPPEKYLQDHPQWYSLIDGKRTAAPATHASLCLTNKEMRQQYIVNTLEETKKDPLARYAGLGAPDDAGPPNMCQCADCVATRIAPNAPSELLASFANEVAAAYMKEQPGMKVKICAYHHYRKPPTNTKLLDNVVVDVCSIECSGSAPISHERNRTFREDMFGWLDVSKRVHIYNYGINFVYEFCPHPNLRAMGADVKYFAENGIKGMFVESGCGASTRTTGYGMEPIRTWILAKLIWNPSLDVQDLIQEFAYGYYGPAGRHVLAYVDLMHDAVEASGDWLGLGSPPDARFLSTETLCQSWAHLKAAEAAVQNDKVFLSRVQSAQLSVLYVFLLRFEDYRIGAEYRGIEWPFEESAQQLSDHFIKVAAENNITLSSKTQVDLSKALEPVSKSVKPDIPPASELRADAEIIFRDLWQKYEPVADLPKEAKFSTDPQQIGENEEWYSKAFNDGSWKYIMVDEFWENQGYQDYDGTGWYRILFTIPDTMAVDKRLFLSFGRMDQAGTIWLNGRHVADYPGPWNSRFEVEVTQFLRPDSDNLLTVKVFGGNGAGGLWAPIKLIALKP